MEVTRKEQNEQVGFDTPEQPIVPPCAKYVWDWWWELNASRPPGYDNLAPTPYTEIRSWKILTGNQPTIQDVRWLRQMDNAWLVVIAQERNDKRDRDKEEAARNKGK